MGLAAAALQSAVGEEKSATRDAEGAEGVREWRRIGRERARTQKLAFSWLKINMHGVDSETFILPA